MKKNIAEIFERQVANSNKSPDDKIKIMEEMIIQHRYYISQSKGWITLLTKSINKLKS